MQSHLHGCKNCVVVRIGSNIASIKAQRSLAESTDALSSIYERLSSGMRINRASDDAAGLAVATSLQIDTRVYTQGIRNLSDGVSLLQIADGALSQLSTIVTRQIELTEQASNGTFGLSQRRSLQSESDALTREFNRILESSQFNGINLFNTSQSSIVLQTGYGTNGTLDVSYLSGFTRRVGTGSYAASLTLTTELARSVEAVDLDNDGDLDMINSNEGGSGSVSVRLNNGDGTFGSALSIGFGAVGVIRMAVGDINGDGIIDIATAGSAGVGYVLGNGNGTFGASVSAAMASGYASYQNLAIGDVNGDGVAEIVAVGDSNGTTRSHVNIYSVSGSTLTLTGQITASYVNDITINQVELSDFNGDGILDILTIGDENTLSMFLGNGNGTFQSRQDLASGFSSGLGFSIADYDRDGDMDIAALAQNRVMLLKNSGTGSFTSVLSVDPQMSTSFVVDAMRWTDVNGDGLLDIGFVTQRTASSATSHFNFLLQNSDGTFGALNQTQIRGDTTLRSFATGDLDGDGIEEFIGGFNGSANTIFEPNLTDSTTGQYFTLMTALEARNSLDLAREALNRISVGRGLLGAKMSRINVALGNLATQRESYSAAYSRIVDADVAQESSQMIAKQILQKIGSTILTQANIQPGIALKLLNN